MKKILLLLIFFLTPLYGYTAILNFAGAETGVTTGDVQSVIGTVAISTSTVKDGQYAYRANPTTTATGAFSIRSANTDGQTNLRWGITRPRITFWFRMATAPATDEEMFADIENASTNRAAFLVMNSARKFGLKDSLGADIATSTNALSLNTWYFVAWDAANGVAATESVSVYDNSCNLVETVSSSGNFTNSTFGVIEVGKRSNLFGNSVDFFYDDVIVDSTTMPTCQMKIGTLMPKGAGVFSQWTAGTGTSDYTQYYERPADTTTYVETATAGNIDTAVYDPIATTTANIGTTDTIHGVNFFAYVREAANTVSTVLQNRFKSGAIVATTTNRDVSTTLVPNQQTFLTDPNTATTWTTTALGVLDAGAICVDPLTTTCRMSQAMINILFTPNTGTSYTGPIKMYLSRNLFINGNLYQGQ